MIRFIFAALLALATIAPAAAMHNPMHYYKVQPAFPKAKNGTITLWYMPGGVVGEHIRQAMVWRDRKYRIVVRDDQYSAAAMMVLWLHVQGSNVCATKGADFFFHGLTHPQTGKRVPHDDMFLSLFGKENVAKIGALKQRSFKRIKPAVFGVPRCK